MSEPTRRALLAAVPAVTVAVVGCSLVSGGSEATPPYVVENETGETRTVALGIWNVGPVRPVEDRRDSFREDFESAVQDGGVDGSRYEWHRTYDLEIAPGSEAAPVPSSNATGLLYVRAVTDDGGAMDHWIEVDRPDEAFFVDISVYENGAMGLTGGEY